MRISEILRKYREEQGLTQEELAAALCENLPGVTKTKQEISSWESDRQIPAYHFMLLVFMAYKDWRYDLAFDCLCVIRPTLFQIEAKNA